MAQPEPITLSAAGVTATLPPQRTEVRIVQLPLESLEKMKPVPGGFQPFRRVINIAVERVDAPGVYVSEFDPPMLLQVDHTAADMQTARRTWQELSLGFWDGTQWVRFTAEKHQFRLGPHPTNPFGGRATAVVSHWGDPTVAWGT